MILKQYSLKALEKAINHAMALDEQLPEKMSSLDGKTLEMIISPLEINFYILFTEGHLKLLDNIEGAPNTTIYSSPIGLIRLSLLPASKARSLFNDKIKIEGDLEFGQQVKKLFDNIDIDWEGHLAQFTGDVVAHQIGSIFRKGRDFTKRFNHSMRMNVTEYLQEELRCFPSRPEIEDFIYDVDELSLRVERLNARIEQQMAKHESN